MSFLLVLPLSPTLQNELGLLRGSLDDVRWLPAEHCMIPLYELGHITARHALEELDATLAHLRWEPFPLSLHEVAHHMGEQDDTLTVGLTPKDTLLAFQKRLSTHLRRAGFPPSRHPFIPRMTIARLDPASPTDLIPWIQRHNLFHSETMMIERMNLMERSTFAGETHLQLLEQYTASPQILPESDFSEDYS